MTDVLQDLPARPDRKCWPQNRPALGAYPPAPGWLGQQQRADLFRQWERRAELRRILADALDATYTAARPDQVVDRLDARLEQLAATA